LYAPVNTRFAIQNFKIREKNPLIRAGIALFYFLPVKLRKSKTGCVTIKPVTIVVNPPPPPITQAVNTFTPNNDGINDYFSVTIVGYGEFGSLRIYSRYGQLVFQTKSPDTPWDGKYNGRPAPVGTYYWLFDGINTYDHSKVVASGFITLIR